MTASSRVNWEPARLARGIKARAAGRQPRALSAGRVVCYAALIVGSLVFVLPLYYMVATGLMGYEQLFKPGLQLIPNPINWQNYPTAIIKIPFLRYTLNTAIVTAGVLLGVTFSSALVGYAFSRINWPGRDQTFILVLATMMLPPQVTMVPIFIVFRQLGWIDTYLPLIVPAFFGHPFYIFLMRQYMTTIPGELADAARIDGCGEFRTFWSIVLPLCRPALAAVVIFAFVATWNDFLHPLIYLNNKELKTLALGLYAFQTEFGIQVPLLMAAGSLVLAPILVVFFLSQRYFIQGITLTGMKG